MTLIHARQLYFKLNILHAHLISNFNPIDVSYTSVFHVYFI